MKKLIASYSYTNSSVIFVNVDYASQTATFSVSLKAVGQESYDDLIFEIVEQIDERVEDNGFDAEFRSYEIERQLNEF